MARVNNSKGVEEEKFLGGFVEFRPAVRLYCEGRATGLPKDKKHKDRYRRKNHATVSGF